MKQPFKRITKRAVKATLSATAALGIIVGSVAFSAPANAEDLSGTTTVDSQQATPTPTPSDAATDTPAAPVEATPEPSQAPTPTDTPAPQTEAPDAPQTAAPAPTDTGTPTPAPTPQDAKPAPVVKAAAAQALADLCFQSDPQTAANCSTPPTGEWGDTNSTLPAPSTNIPAVIKTPQGTNANIGGFNALYQPDTDGMKPSNVVSDGEVTFVGAYYTQNPADPAAQPLTLNLSLPITNQVWKTADVVGVEASVLPGSEWTNINANYTEHYTGETSTLTALKASGTRFTAALDAQGSVALGATENRTVTITFPSATFQRTTTDGNGTLLNAYGYEGLITVMMRATDEQGNTYYVPLQEAVSFVTPHHYDITHFQEVSCPDGMCAGGGSYSFYGQAVSVPIKASAPSNPGNPSTNNNWITNTCSVDNATNKNGEVTTNLHLVASGEYFPLTNSTGIVIDPASGPARYVETGTEGENNYTFQSDIQSASYTETGSNADPANIDLTGFNVVDTRDRTFKIVDDSHFASGKRIDFYSAPIALTFPYNGSSTDLTVSLAVGGEGGAEFIDCSLAAKAADPTPVVTPTPAPPAAKPDASAPQAPAQPQADKLAYTGNDITPLIYGGAALAIFGVALRLLAHFNRRKEARQTADS